MAGLFEYAIVYNPKSTKDAQGNDTTPPSKVLQPITQVLASNQEEVRIVAAREIPAEYLNKLGEVAIVVRPF